MVSGSWMGVWFYANDWKVFLWLYTLVHVYLWIGAFHIARWCKEKEVSRGAGCHWFAERTFHSARCSKEAIGGRQSLGNTIGSLILMMCWNKEEDVPWIIQETWAKKSGVTLRNWWQPRARCVWYYVLLAKGYSHMMIILNNLSSPGSVLSMMKYCGLIPTLYPHLSFHPQRTELHIFQHPVRVHTCTTGTHAHTHTQRR